MLVDKHLPRICVPEISEDYIRGLSDSEGCFTFYPNKTIRTDGSYRTRKMPAFVLRMHERDAELIKKVKEKLFLKEKIYIFYPWRKDGHDRGGQAALIVRYVSNLKNKIVPLFYGKLIGYKARQFY